jgi:hypothetical protein
LAASADMAVDSATVAAVPAAANIKPIERVRLRI